MLIIGATGRKLDENWQNLVANLLFVNGVCECFDDATLDSIKMLQVSALKWKLLSLTEIQLLYSFMKYDYEKLIMPSFREFYKLSTDI